jgi:hypothetical protein
MAPEDALLSWPAAASGLVPPLDGVVATPAALEVEGLVPVLPPSAPSGADSRVYSEPQLWTLINSANQAAPRTLLCMKRILGLEMRLL